MLDTRLSAAKERWLGELYEADSAAVLKLCWRLLSNPQDAADACQEVFLRAASSLDPDTPRDHARGWLLTVARNYCLDQLRRQKRMKSALSAMSADSDGAADPESSVVNRQLVDAIFKQLSERERDALWQTAVEHRPLADVATRLRLNYMAAGQVVSRARRHAAMLAAKVAVVFVALRIIARRAGVLPARLVAATAVPVMLLAVQPSSSPIAASAPPIVQSPAAKQAPVAKPASGSTHAADASSSPSFPGVTLPVPAPQASVPPLPLPSGVSGAAGSATGVLNGILRKLPTPPPLPSPSLPSPPPIK